MRIAVIHGNDGSDVRIGKICRSLSRLGHDVHFVGWDRRPDSLKSIELGAASRHILASATRHGRGDVSGYARFARHIIMTLRTIRPEAVHCVNEDFSLLVLPFRGWLFDTLVCDVFDSLTDRHSHRGALVGLLTRVTAELVRCGVDRLIATDETRHATFGRHRSKTVIIENVPEDPGEQLSMRLPVGPIKIYVAGTLSKNRGLRQVLQTVEQSPQEIQIISAGWPYDDYAADVFVKHPKVKFEGIVTAWRSLELASECDAVFAFYAPTSRNNILASPNKIYDASSVGRPVIINTEARVSEWVRANRLGWSCGYQDQSALSGILGRLAAARGNLPEFARHARRLYTAGHTWSIMEQRLDVLYRCAKQPSEAIDALPPRSLSLGTAS
jgi:glycosyltransferase involved in cell wall biosynthesis